MCVCVCVLCQNSEKIQLEYVIGVQFCTIYPKLLFLNFRVKRGTT